MIIVMRTGAARSDIDRVLRMLEVRGIKTYVFEGKERVVVTSLGSTPGSEVLEALEVLPGVDRVTPLTSPHTLAGRQAHPDDTVVSVGSALVGGGEFTIFAGPSVAHSPGQVLQLGGALAELGVAVLRIGANASLRSTMEDSPNGEVHAAETARAAGLPILAEVDDPSQVALLAATTDVLQVSAQNMQNASLLRAVAGTNRPVLIERGLSATVDEWLLAAEYVMREGNPRVILCERGIRTFEADRAATLDLSSIPVLKRMTHLPVVVNASQGTGHRYMVQPMALAAAAVGADGLVVEVHLGSDADLVEGPQSLSLDDYQSLLNALQPVLGALGRKLSATH